MAVYVDTSAWIALTEPKEKNHQRARTAIQALAKTGDTLVSGWHTVVEYADGVARRRDQRAAARRTALILASPRVAIVDSEPHMAAAVRLLATRTEWEVDLSDCLSFAVMEARGIRRALTFDKDFAKPGFTIEG